MNGGKFQGERLTQAREFKQMTKLAVAEFTGVVSSTVSKWESGESAPRTNHVERMAELFGFDSAFFFRPTFRKSNSELLFWRSQSQVTKSARDRGRSQLSWLKEITSYAWRFFETPPVNLPRLDVPRFEDLGGDQIDGIAEDLRDFWGLGRKPIPHLVRMLERNGIVVGRSNLNAESLDATSEFTLHPFILLSSFKSNAFRSRFDAAHELGHIILHKAVTQKTLNTVSKYAQIEKQAHRFASAFLLPEKGFVRELWAPTLDTFRAQKERWGVSIAAQLMRAKDLGLVNDDQARRLNVQISKRNWRKVEPLDGRTPPEQPMLLRKCFETLIESGDLCPSRVLLDLRLPKQLICELANLPSSFFDMESEETEPPLEIIQIGEHSAKSKGQGRTGEAGDNILEFDFSDQA